MDFRFLKQALSGYWLISESGAQFYSELLQQVIDNRNSGVSITAGLFDNVDKPYRANSAGTNTVKGNVLVMPVEGVLMQTDNCGAMGTESMGNLLELAYKDKSIDAIVLKMRSPGGSVSGTENLANIVKAANKPVVTWTDQMCSAAYWIGSGSAEIMISGETAMVGSIGTMAKLKDNKAQADKKGYKEVVMYASRSVHKNRSTQQALDGNPDAFIAEFLDPLNAAFEQRVMQNRAGKIDLAKEDVLTGKVYIGSNIINVGLADSMGNLTAAIKRSIQISKSL